MSTIVNNGTTQPALTPHMDVCILDVLGLAMESIHMWLGMCHMCFSDGLGMLIMVLMCGLDGYFSWFLFSFTWWSPGESWPVYPTWSYLPPEVFVTLASIWIFHFCYNISSYIISFTLTYTHTHHTLWKQWKQAQHLNQLNVKRVVALKSLWPCCHWTWEWLKW